MRTFTGASMMAVLFGGLFIWIWYQNGFKIAVIVYFSVAGIGTWVIAAAFLLGAEGL